MHLLFLFVLLMGVRPDSAADKWVCKNDIEVWCGNGECTAKKADETTPMSIAVSGDGAFSVCAYTGCWEGDATVGDVVGRRIWAAEDIPFSSRPDGELKSDVTVLIIEADGTGYVRVGGIATPLTCLRAEPHGIAAGTK